MAGIYIHIPFCKQACNYCNFYFSVSQGLKNDVLAAIRKEIEHTKNYLQGETIHTIYFGGGTPSLLAADEIKVLIETIHRHHHCDIKEMTLEANPDDLTHEQCAKLAELQPYGLNRFSIGVQSFFDDDLRYMNRAHSSHEATDSIKRIQDKGFDLLTIDLIYGTPTMSNEQWLQNIQTAVGLNIPHLSCYALTVEPKTTLEQKIRTRQLHAVDEQKQSEQFDLLMSKTRDVGFEHYEISNFALPEKYAVHNTNYWKGIPYIGIGPSAHSFNGAERRWNVSNNKNYIEGIISGIDFFEAETLTPIQQINEYIMTSLRTIWGLSLNDAKVQKVKTEILQSLESIDKTHFRLVDENITLTNSGKHFADSIAAELFLEDGDS